MKYEVRTEGASEAITADSLESALDQAKTWLAEGDWDTTEGTVWVHGYLIVKDEDGDEIDQHRVEAEVDPIEPDCIDGEEHDWQSPIKIVGGIKENPGVWGHGGGITMQEVCLRCGCGKLTDTWAQDPETGRQGLRSVKYEPEKYAPQVAALAPEGE